MIFIQDFDNFNIKESKYYSNLSEIERVKLKKYINEQKTKKNAEGEKDSLLEKKTLIPKKIFKPS